MVDPLAAVTACPVTVVEATACGQRDCSTNPWPHCDGANCAQPMSPHDPSGADVTRPSSGGLVVQTCAMKFPTVALNRNKSCVPVPASATPQIHSPSAEELN